MLAQEVGWALPTNPKTLWWAVPTLLSGAVQLSSGELKTVSACLSESSLFLEDARLRESSYVKFYIYWCADPKPYLAARSYCVETNHLSDLCDVR